MTQESRTKMDITKKHQDQQEAKRLAGAGFRRSLETFKSGLFSIEAVCHRNPIDFMSNQVKSGS
jgi:hypothetical protein